MNSVPFYLRIRGNSKRVVITIAEEGQKKIKTTGHILHNQRLQENHNLFYCGAALALATGECACSVGDTDRGVGRLIGPSGRGIISANRSAPAAGAASTPPSGLSPSFVDVTSTRGSSGRSILTGLC